MGCAVPVYIALQQTDLHCISALEAIQHSMKIESVTGLRRFRVLVFEVESANAADAESLVGRVLSTSFDVLNPNKETAYIGQLPTFTSAVDSVQIGVAVRNQDVRLREVKSVYFRQFPEIKSVTTELFWVVTARKDGRSMEAVAADIRDFVVGTKSRTQGLLANRLFETFDIQVIGK
ncbi:hypothetical protein EBR96_01805 [bacterium]|nr:hypothetical protein [bacterium]